MLEEFKRFVLGGNMVDMAVGIVIGAAFGTIVGSLVEDILLPPIVHWQQQSQLVLSPSIGVISSIR